MLEKYNNSVKWELSTEKTGRRPGLMVEDDEKKLSPIYASNHFMPSSWDLRIVE